MTTAAHIIGALLRFLFAVVRLVVTLAVHEQMPRSSSSCSSPPWSCSAG